MLEDYERRWRTFCEWMDGKHPEVAALEDVTTAQAREFVRWLDKGDLSANRRNKIVQGCRLMFRVMAEECRDMANPFRNITNRRLTTKPHRELSEGELLKVCSSAEGELRTLLAVGLYTALRLADACLLRWEDVALHRNRLTVTPRKTRRTGKALVIPLHPVLRDILEETPQAERIGYVVPGLAADYQRDTAKVCKMLRRHFLANGIETQERHKDQRNATCVVGFHSLRHSFVSLCAAKGVPLAVVQELCGHGSPAIQRHYIHLGPDATEAAMQALPSINGREKDTEEHADRKRLTELIRAAPIEQVREALLVADLRPIGRVSVHPCLPALGHVVQPFLAGRPKISSFVWVGSKVVQLPFAIPEDGFQVAVPDGPAFPPLPEERLGTLKRLSLQRPRRRSCTRTTGPSRSHTARIPRRAFPCRLARPLVEPSSAWTNRIRRCSSSGSEFTWSAKALISA